MIAAHVHQPAAHAAAGELGWVASAVALAVLVVTYVVGIVRRTGAMGRPWSGWRTAAWVTGSVLLVVGASPWLTSLAHADARAHMVQHLVLGMYAPLGLVLAAPVTLLLGASSTTNRRRLSSLLASPPVRFLSHPMIAGLINVGGLYVLYLTGLYAASMSSTPLQLLVNAHFLLGGALFTWSIAGPDPAPHRPPIHVRVAALVLAAGAHAYLAQLLYARAGELPPGGHHSATEIEQAAQWMYYGGDVAELALAAALFTTWYRARGRGVRVTDQLDRGATPLSASR